MQQKNNRVRIMMFETNHKGLTDIAAPLNKYLVSGLKYAQLFAKTQCDMTSALLNQQQQVREAAKNAKTPAQHWDAQQQYNANVLSILNESTQAYLQDSIELLSTNEQIIANNDKSIAAIESSTLNKGALNEAVQITRPVKVGATKKAAKSVVKKDVRVKSTVTKKAVGKTKVAKVPKTASKPTITAGDKAVMSHKSIKKKAPSVSAVEPMPIPVAKVKSDQ